VRPQDRRVLDRVREALGDEQSRADRIRRAGIRDRLEHARRKTLDVGGGVGGDLDELALHHRHRTGIVNYGTRTDQREDVVLAGLLHRVGLIEDLRVVVLEYQLTPVDPAQAVAELNEGLDRTVDTGCRNRDHSRLVGDDTDGDGRV